VEIGAEDAAFVQPYSDVLDDLAAMLRRARLDMPIGESMTVGEVISVTLRARAATGDHS
jgi:hypothetical protein